MRYFALLSCLCLLSACQFVDGFFAAPAEAGRPIPAYDQHSLIIRYDEAIGDAALLEAADARGAAVLSHYPMLSTLILAIPKDSDLDEARQHLRSVAGVREINFQPVQ